LLCECVSYFVILIDTLHDKLYDDHTLNGSGQTAAATDWHITGGDVETGSIFLHLMCN